MTAIRGRREKNIKKRCLKAAVSINSEANTGLILSNNMKKGC